MTTRYRFLIKKLIPAMLLSVLAGCVTPSAPPAVDEPAAGAVPNWRRGMVLAVTRNGKSADRRTRALAAEYLRGALVPSAGPVRISDADDLKETAQAKKASAPDVLMTVALLEIRETAAGNAGRECRQNALVRLTSMRDGIAITAFEVECAVTPREEELPDAVEPRLLRGLMRQTAGKLVTRTSAVLKIKVHGPQGDPDFKAANVRIRLGGAEVKNGDRVPFGEYTLRAELDGYRAIRRRIRITSPKQGRMTLTFDKVGK